MAAKSAVTPLTMEPKSNATLPAAKETSHMTALYICEALNCDVPLFTNTSRVCKKHEMENKHRIASARKAGPPIKLLPRQTIDKPKLYPINPDQDMKEYPSIWRKRKREMPTKQSTSYNGPNLTTEPRLKTSTGLITNNTAKAKCTPEDTQRLLSQASSRQKDRQNRDPFPFQRLAALNPIDPPGRTVSLGLQERRARFYLLIITLLI
jgi:hypothetical protein